MVVKNGAKMRATVAGRMPEPWSETSGPTSLPVGGSGGWRKVRTKSTWACWARRDGDFAGFLADGVGGVVDEVQDDLPALRRRRARWGNVGEVEAEAGVFVD